MISWAVAVVISQRRRRGRAELSRAVANGRRCASPVSDYPMATELSGSHEPRQHQQTPVGVSEPAFVEVEMGYALRVAGRSWADSRGPRGSGVVFLAVRQQCP
jgi:hypothetical protein